MNQIPEKMRLRFRKERRGSLILAAVLITPLVLVLLFFTPLHDYIGVDAAEMVVVPMVLGAFVGLFCLINSWACVISHGGGTCGRCWRSVPAGTKPGDHCPWCEAFFYRASGS